MDEYNELQGMLQQDLEHKRNLHKQELQVLNLIQREPVLIYGLYLAVRIIKIFHFQARLEANRNKRLNKMLEENSQETSRSLKEGMYGINDPSRLPDTASQLLQSQSLANTMKVGMNSKHCGSCETILFLDMYCLMAVWKRDFLDLPNS